MNTAATLALISDLYAQLTAAQQECAALREQNGAIVREITELREHQSSEADAT